jgi:hypothetical protein
MNKKIITLLLASIISSCAYNSGVIVDGENQFSLTRQAASGFQGHGKLKSEAVDEGKQFCSAMKKKFELVSQERICEIMLPGCFPAIEISFKCVD